MIFHSCDWENWILASKVLNLCKGCIYLHISKFVKILKKFAWKFEWKLIEIQKPSLVFCWLLPPHSKPATLLFITIECPAKKIQANDIYLVKFRYVLLCFLFLPFFFYFSPFYLILYSSFTWNTSPTGGWDLFLPTEFVTNFYDFEAYRSSKNFKSVIFCIIFIFS